MKTIHIYDGDLLTIKKILLDEARLYTGCWKEKYYLEIFDRLNK